jgi:hypothetical protein
METIEKNLTGKLPAWGCLGCLDYFPCGILGQKERGTLVSVLKKRERVLLCALFSKIIGKKSNLISPFLLPHLGYEKKRSYLPGMYILVPFPGSRRTASQGEPSGHLVVRPVSTRAGGRLAHLRT